MNTGLVQTMLTLLTILLGGYVHAEGPTILTHNPFSRPPVAISDDKRTLLQRDGVAMPLDLRATMVSPTSRLANVAGRTLTPGDEVQGYILVKIFEDRAVFSRAGKQLTIYVKPNPDEDDE